MTDPDLNELAGAVIMVGFRGLELPATSRFAHQLRELHLAGTVLFDVDVGSGGPRNIADAAQVGALVRRLHQAAGRPLLVAVDQEGGAVARLKPAHGFPELPAHGELGGSDPAQTRRVVEPTARALADAGIGINFAPVVDLNLNPRSPAIGARRRSFSDQPGRVLEHARAFISAHRAYGLATTLKHFPGHGSAAVDTHTGLADITDSFREVELWPYRELIAARLADLIMVAHLRHRAWDPHHPATLSERVITGLLRGDLGYDGVVVSDDLDMAAVADAYPLRQRVVLALHAGVDLLLFGNNLSYDPHRPAAVHEAIVRAVNDGELSRSCLRQHAQRVRALAHRVCGP